MRAEREKRAVILTSEGVRDAKINEAEGEKQRVIKESEAAKTQQINEAQGEAEAILAVATATAEGLRRVANAVIDQGGPEAMQLRIAEQYIGEFGNLAKTGNTYVVPANLGDLTSMMALATDIAKGKGKLSASRVAAGSFQARVGQALRLTDTTLGSCSSFVITVLNVGRSLISMLMSMTTCMDFLSVWLFRSMTFASSSASKDVISRISPERSNACRLRSTG